MRVVRERIGLDQHGDRRAVLEHGRDVVGGDGVLGRGEPEGGETAGEERLVGAGIAGGIPGVGRGGRDRGGRLVVFAREPHIGHGDDGRAGARDAQRAVGVVDVAPAAVPVEELRIGALGDLVAVARGGLVGAGIVRHKADGLGLGDREGDHTRVGVGVGVRGDLVEPVGFVERRRQRGRDLGRGARGDTRVERVAGRALAALSLLGAAAHTARDTDNQQDQDDDRTGEQEQRARVFGDARTAAATLAREIDVALAQVVARVGTVDGAVVAVGLVRLLVRAGPTRVERPVLLRAGTAGPLALALTLPLTALAGVGVRTRVVGTRATGTLASVAVGILVVVARHRVPLVAYTKVSGAGQNARAIRMRCPPIVPSYAIARASASANRATVPSSCDRRR